MYPPSSCHHQAPRRDLRELGYDKADVGDPTIKLRMLKGVVVVNTPILIKGPSEVIRPLKPEGLGKKELEGTGAS